MRAGTSVAESRVIDPEVTDVSGPTHPSAPSVSTTATTPEGPPPPPRHVVDGPPPPPAGSGSEAESRATAAAWVAAVGATLLLAAAGTFLAVSWDGLGLTVRVAVVAGVTGAAVLGGQRLRRVLPAVGAVVFHLGALLVPLDALGLAYQLDAGLAVRWAAVGLTASLALPVLAVVGRSPLLGLAGLAGLPAVATAAGIAGVAPAASVLVALAVMAAIAEAADVEVADAEVADAGPLALARRVAAPGLASLAVLLPLIFALTARLAGSGTVLGSAAGGWVASSWVLPAGVGVAAVGVLAVTASRRHDTGIAGLALASAAVSVVLTVLPPATPRAVVLLAPAVVWLLAEVAALAGRDHVLWDAPTRTIAAVLEVIALVGVSSAAIGLLVTASWSGVRPDTALAAQSSTLAAAWLVAAVRRTGSEGSDSGRVVVWLLTAVVVHLAAASLQLGGVAEIAGVVLLGGALGSLGVLLDGGARTAALTGSAARGAAPFAVLGLSVLSLGVLVDRDASGVLLLAVPLVMGAHLAAALRARESSVVAPVTALVASVVLVGWCALAIEERGSWPVGVALLAGVVGLLWLSAAVDRLEPVADTLRAVAMVAGLVLLVPSMVGGPVVSGGSRTGMFWAFGLRVSPAAVVPAVVIATWLTVEALRRRRAAIATLAAPVVVRAVAAGLLSAGVPVRTTGAVLLGVAVGGACAAALGPRGLLGPMLTGGAVAGIVGWLLVGDAPSLRAGLLIAAGLGIAAVGARRRRPVVAHLGGVVATIGIWQLLDLGRITALDVWLLPVAVQLAVAGELARRRGSSSWVAFVPSLLLVAVPAIAERLTGGPGWHAVLAGGVGVVAVLVGGARRLGGPLIVGTVVTVAVVLMETFAVVAEVPTWVWLAVGGLSLLGAAAQIERVGGSPVRAVRRAVDVVGERFD